MKRLAPLRFLGGPFAALSARWAGVTRHRRLRFAVVSCLFVMFTLVVALVVTVRLLHADANASLGGATAHSEVAALLTEGADALRQYETGSVTAIERLTAINDQLASQVYTDADGRDFDVAALAEVVDAAETVIDADRATRAPVTTILRTAADFERLAGEFTLAADAQTVSTLENLDRWFSWMQIVAVVAAVIFMLAVFGAILPLIRSIERSLGKLQGWRDRSTRDADRRSLAAQVTDGLDVAETEERAKAVIGRALRVAAPDMKVELLLADSSNAHLRVAVEHPEHGPAGCGVASPWSCPAVRRGSTMSFEDSKAIRSCPHLADHAEPCSAVCSPLTFMGKPLGVLHATGPVGEMPERAVVEDLALVASESANRLGTLRAITTARLQAETDVLTGLPNRRAATDRLTELISQLDGGAIALIEIDGVMALNEQLGKEAGDRAMKVTAESLQFSSREGDFLGRWGGAEFVAIFAGHDAAAAREAMVQFHADLTASFDRADLQGLQVQIGIADTRLADSSRDLLQLANDALGEGRAIGEWRVQRSGVVALPKRVR